MGNALQTIKKDQSDNSLHEYQIKIDNHRKAAHHHEEAGKINLDSDDELKERRLQVSHQRAAKHHLEAAKFHEAGEHSKASDSSIKAHWFASIATEISNEDIHSNTING
jgi:hypothetical protein